MCGAAIVFIAHEHCHLALYQQQSAVAPEKMPSRKIGIALNFTFSQLLQGMRSTYLSSEEAQNVLMLRLAGNYPAM